MNIDFKAEIQKRGLKQRFIVEQLGINETTFSNKLAGRNKFTADEIIKLVNLLGINPQQLFKEA